MTTGAAEHVGEQSPAEPRPCKPVKQPLNQHPHHGLTWKQGEVLHEHSHYPSQDGSDAGEL